MRLRKLLWGVLAFAPWWGFVLFSVFVWRGTVPLSVVQRDFLIFGNALVLLVLLCFLVQVNHLKAADREKKWLWRGLLVFGHVFALPLFWYFHIWKGPIAPDAGEDKERPL
jgi:hypothetical protein